MSRACPRRSSAVSHELDRSTPRCAECWRSRSGSGLLDDPYRRCRAAPAPPTALAERRALAREAARRSIVLLDDKAGLLPLAPAPRRLAVIGPLADAGPEMLRPLVGRRRPDGGGEPARRPARSLSGHDDPPRPGVPIEDDDESGIPSAVGVGAGGRPRPALPRRAALHERRGGEPGPAGAAGPPAGAGRWPSWRTASPPSPC